MSGGPHLEKRVGEARQSNSCRILALQCFPVGFFPGLGTQGWET